MICKVCSQTQFTLQCAHLTIEKDGKTLHVDNAPVFVCNACGERFLDDAVIADISKALDIVFSPDTQIQILDASADVQ